MVDEAEAELFGDPLLKHLQFIIDELDDIAGLDVDQMIVMRVRRRFVARMPVTMSENGETVVRSCAIVRS